MQRASPRQWAAAIAGLAGITVAAIWDEVFFAAPAVALTARIGGIAAFLFLLPLYVAFGTGVSLLLVGRKQREHRVQSRLEIFIDSMAKKTENSRIRRKLVAGTAMGFFLSSWLLGGILTSWLLRVVGLKNNVPAWAIASNIIWAITFLAQYTGIAALIF